MCVCVFIKLHITAQSGPVILVILCHSHWPSQGGINDTCYEKLWSNATKGTHSLYLYKSYLSPEHLVLPPLFPCCSPGYPSWQLLNQPFLSTFFSLSTHVSPVSRTASTAILRLLALFCPLPPSPILFSLPLSSSPFPSPLQSSLTSRVCVCHTHTLFTPDPYSSTTYGIFVISFLPCVLYQAPGTRVYVNTNKHDDWSDWLIDWILPQANVKNPARGHKVEKHHYSEGKDVRHTLHTKRKRQWYKKYSEKATPPNEQK